MDESDELSGLEGMLALTWVSLAVMSCTQNNYNFLCKCCSNGKVGKCCVQRCPHKHTHTHTSVSKSHLIALLLYSKILNSAEEHFLTVLSFKLSCPISFLSSAGSTTSPPIKSSIFVCAALALILLRMARRTEPIVSLVCDQISRSST